MPPPAITTAKTAIADYQANHAMAPVSVADTASDLLTSLAGLGTLQSAGKIASITITGTSNQLTAAQVNLLSTLPGISLGTGAALTVSDTASNLLAGGSGFGIVSSFQLIGDNTVNAAQAKALVSLAGFRMSGSAILHVIDTAAALLNPANAAGVAAATYTLAAGSSNIVSAAQCAALAALPGFGMLTGATLQVMDTAAAILANAASIKKFATGATLVGTNIVTASQAASVVALRGFTIASGATLTVSDTSAALLASGGQPWIGKATGVVLSGLSNNVTAYQATVLAGFTGFTVGAGASLVVTDTAANLLLASRAAGVANATSVVLTGSANNVTAAQAEALAAMNGFSVASGATLAVSDLAGNLVAPGNAAGLAFATSVHLIGDSSINATQAETLVGLAGYTKSANAVLHVIDSAANLLDPANAAGVAAATYALVSGTSVVSASQVTALAALPRFGGAPGSILTAEDTVSGVLSNLTAVARYASNTVLTGTNTINASQAAALATVYHLSLAPQASLVVTDTYANIEALQTSLLSNPAGYTMPTGYTENVIGVPVASATAYEANPIVTSFTISDTAANLSGTAFTPLNFDDKLTAITPTDAGVLQLTYTQLVGLGHALSLVTGNFSLNVTGVPVADADAVQTNPLVTQFSVTDAFQNVSVAYFQLHTYSKLETIYPTLSAPYDPASLPTIGMYQPNILTLTDVPVAMADTVQGIASVASFTVTDTAANITSGLSSLVKDTNITGMNITGTSGGDTLDLSGTFASANINLGGDNASASAGLSAPSLSFIGTPDAIMLSTGPSTIQYAMQPGSGIETISHFVYGVDALDINLEGANSSMLEAFDTTVNGAAAIAITSSADTSHGVVLLGVSGIQTAAGLMANHTTFSGGIAVIK